MKFVCALICLITMTTVYVPATCQVQIGQSLFGESNGDFFGSALDISDSGNRIIVGANMNDGVGIDAGHARVFEYNGQFWVQLGNDIEAEFPGDHFGKSVSISSNGEIIAVGAKFNDGNGGNSGSVRVYEFNGTAWVQIGNDIDGESAGDQSGYSISLSGDGSRIVIGAPKNINVGISSGHARLFEYNGSSWVQLGSDLDGEAPLDEFGSSVDISYTGDYIAVSSVKNATLGNNTGQVRVFKYQPASTTGWIQLGSDIDGLNPQDSFGSSISLSEDGYTIAIGATNNSDNGPQAGQVRVLQFDGNLSWVQLGSAINGTSSQDHFGFSVSLSNNGTRLMAGSPFNDDGGTDAGQCRFFEFDSSDWVQYGSTINGATNSVLGSSVAISGNGLKAIIGAPSKNGDSPGEVHAYILDAFVGINNETDKKHIIYPNPTTGILTIIGHYDQVSVYDASGRFIKCFKNAVDLSEFHDGFYTLIILSDHKFHAKQILKN